MWSIVDVGNCLIVCTVGRFVLPWKVIEEVTVLTALLWLL
jgi:hypothetical protein